MQSFEVPQNLQCFLCNKYFIKSSHPFILYQCGKCLEKTSYCLFCSNITNKLLDNITFKCKFCNSLQRSKFKEEITKQNDDNNSNNENIYNFSPIIKTPSKENLYLSNIKNNVSNLNVKLKIKNFFYLIIHFFYFLINYNDLINFYYYYYYHNYY